MHAVAAVAEGARTEWDELVLGRARASHRVEHDAGTILVLCPCEEPPPGPVLTARQLRVIERLAAGDSYGEIAFELSLELSTVATHVARALAVTGLHRLELPMLVLGAARGSRAWSGDISVSYPRVDARSLPELASAERDVVRRLLRGASNERIAADRGTAQRTVANQIFTAFKKLRVSSRMELAALVARRARDEQARGGRRLVALA